MTLFRIDSVAKFRRAAEIATSSAKYVFRVSLDPSIVEKVAVGAVLANPVVVVSQIAPPIPTIPLFADEHVATSIP
jgi:hypothetical protein